MKSLIKYHYVVFVFLLFVQDIFSQNYLFKHITTHDGLAAEEVTGFTQDDKGFIWIATDGGLQRFDGENFITYRHYDNDTASLFYDEVFNPVIDKEKNIWIKNAGSFINILNLNTRKVRKVAADNDKPECANDSFALYCRGDQGTMWICRRNALYRYNYRKNKAEKIASFPDSVFCLFSAPVTCDSATGTIWIGTTRGLMEYDLKKNIFYYSGFNPQKDAVLFPKSELLKIFIDRQRNLWLSTWDWQLFRYNLKTHSFKQFHIPVILPGGGQDNAMDRVMGFVQDHDDNVWIGTDKGSILKYDMQPDSFAVAIPQLYEKAYSNNTAVDGMFNDREGNIWIGTAYGVYFFNPERQKIFSVENNPFTKLSFPPRQVDAFYETSDGLIWVASRDGGGVSVFDEQMHLINRIFYQSDHANKEIAGNSIWSFCEDHYGKLWMAGYNILACYDLVTRKISFLKVPGMNYPAYSMKNDENGNLWIGGSQLIIKLNPLTKQFTVYSNLNDLFKNRGSEIRDMLIDTHRNFWVGTLYGLFRFDILKGKYAECFIHNDDGPKSNSEDEITCITEYNDSTLLLGTAKGLEFFDINTKKFTPLKCNDGSLSNVIQGVSRDKEGNIFTATFNGLYKIDSGTHNYTHYDYDDGISDNQFYTKIYKMRDGRMLAGGLNSFIYFNPEDLKETYTPPDVQVTGFKIFDRQYATESLLNSSNAIHLNFDQNFITIQFASLYYHSPAEIHYYYKLEGVDKNWMNGGNARYATYTNLDNGNYTFKVKCINDDGVACKNITLLRIEIATPYYKSWWFILLCAAALASMVYAAYDYRLRSRRNISIIRRRIASDLHDDIGSTLNSISVYSEVVGQQLQSNTEQAKTILEKMGSASRSMIDNMNDIVWAINPKNDDFENILQRMEYFAGELLSAKNILLQFEADENIKKIKLPMEKRKNFYLIYKEAINNACKYAESKNVNVSIAEKGGSLIMIITDNGKGFDIVTNGLGGNGLKNMNARAGEIGAQFEINSWPGKGTRVFLKMKV